MPSVVHETWRCGRCGSNRARLRPNGDVKECADCRLLREEAQRRVADDEALDFPITPAMRAYLAAFDAGIRAWRDGDHARARAAKTVRHAALAQMESQARLAPH